MVNFKSNNLNDSSFKILLVIQTWFYQCVFFVFKLFSEMLFNSSQTFEKENSFFWKMFLLQQAAIY